PNVAWLVGTYAVGYLVGFVVPFLPGGLGAREGALGAVYAARFGAAVATALVLTIRLVTTLGEVVAVGLIELAWPALRTRRRARILHGSCRSAFSSFSPVSVCSRRVRWPAPR